MALIKGIYIGAIAKDIGKSGGRGVQENGFLRLDRRGWWSDTVAPCRRIEVLRRSVRL